MAEGNLSHRSETESIKTEEFVSKFEDIVKDEENPIRRQQSNSSISKSRALNQSNVHSRPSQFSSSKLMPNLDNGDISDSESIKTEDFQREFKKSLTQYSESLPNFEEKSLTRTTLANISNQPFKPSFSDSKPSLSKMNMPYWSKSSTNLGLSSAKESSKPATVSSLGTNSFYTNFKSRVPLQRSQSKDELFNYIADPEVDSIMTEDYENRFTSMMALDNPPPFKSFDDSFVGLAQNVRAHKLKDRVAHHFNVPPSRVKLPEKPQYSHSSYDIDRRFEEIMETRRKNQPLSKNISFSESTPSGLSRALTLPRNARLPGHLSNRNPHRIPLSATRANVFSPVREVNSPVPNFKETPFTQEADYATEIKARSRLVQKEIEEERRRITRTQSLPPEKLLNTVTPNHGTPRERQSLDMKIVELDQLTRSVRTAKLEKERLTEDISHLEETMRRHQADVRLSEKLANDNRNRADETHSELSQAERRRDQTMRELNRMNEQLEKTKLELEDYEDKMRIRVHEIKGLDGMGYDREEIDKVIAERDELYNLIQKNDSTEQEKYELQKQINSLKVELIDEQDKSKENISALEEELESSYAKIIDLRREKEQLQNHLSSVEERFRFLQDEYNKSEIETKHLQMEYENKMRIKLEELDKEKQKIEGDTETKEKLRRIQAEYDRGYKLVEQLRDQIHNLECENTSLRHSNSKLKEENENRIQRFEDEKRSALQSLRDELRSERATAIGELRSRYEKNRTMNEEHLMSELAEVKNKLINREEELAYLKETYRQQEIKIKHIQEEFKIESREKIRETVRKERQNWEKDEKERWHKELDEIKQDTNSKLTQAKENEEKCIAEMKRLENQVETLKKELKAEKKGFEIALKKCREEVKEQASQEISKAENLVKKEMEKEIKKLAESQSQKEEECRQLSHKFHKLKMRESELSSAIERLEKTVVSEINEECTKMAHILGVNPRKVNLPELHSETGDISTRSRGTSVTTALANLEACGEEMRSYVEELKFQNKDLQNNREADMKAMRKQLKSENLREIQEVREKLLKEHLVEINRLSKEPQEGMNEILKSKDAEIDELQNNMQKWKEETTERLATKLQEEFKKEFDKKLRDLRQTVHDKDQILNVNKREMEKLAREVKSLKSGSNGEIKPGLIAQLQENIKKLREENMALSKSAVLCNRRGSTQIETAAGKKPERKDFNQRILEQKLLDAELKAKAAEQRVKDLELNLSHKSGSVEKVSLRSSGQPSPLIGSVDSIASQNGVSNYSRKYFQ